MIIPLKVRKLSFAFGEVPVLKDVSFDVNPGEIVAITGPSGVGKSTLLSLILGLLTPQSGEITVSGQPVSSGMNAEVARLRRESMGMVFQAGYLLDELTPLENVILPALVNGQSFDLAKKRGQFLFESFGLTDFQRATQSLSGGRAATCSYPASAH